MTDESDWKQHHANEADKALGHPLVEHVIAEQMDNLGTDSALVRYGLAKIAHYAAMVARAQTLGFDPDLLRLSSTEANAELLRVAAEAMTHSDYCYAAAAILFGLVAVYSVVKDNVSGALYALGLALVAIGLLIA